MIFNPTIFRAYDIRGVYGRDLDEGVFHYIGFLLGARRKRVFVAHDIRYSSKNLALALISGLSQKGAEIFFGGSSPFGLAFFSGSFLKADIILFVTASHLPKEWNGLKIAFGDGEPWSSSKILNLKNQFLKIKTRTITFTKKQQYKKVALKREYSATLINFFPTLKNNQLKIVIDCGNGSLSLFAPDFFRKMGFQVKELFCEPNPDFPNRPSEPTIEALTKLRDTVIKEKADFGVAFDGDGDRAVIVDNKGRYLGGNQTGIILGKEILPYAKRKRVVKTVSCTMAIEEELGKLGAEIIEVPVGHNFVISACKAKKAVLGIEESSHLVMPQYFLFDDGILVPLKIAEILLKQEKKLSEIVDHIRIYPFKEISLECSDEKKFHIVKKAERAFKGKNVKMNKLDGVKIYFKDGWVLIRASNTSPKIKLYLEAKTKERLLRWEEEFKRKIRSWIKQ